jgi:hypothetical protein
MSNGTTLDVQDVGRRAAEILDQLKGHPLHERLTGSSMKYSTCWATFTGMATVSRFNMAMDSEPLVAEALKAMAIKAAVFDLTGGDEEMAELLLPLPVDDMIHAVLAQHTVISRIERDLEVTFPHDTALEEFNYSRGCVTDRYYAAAGFGDQPLRYWLDGAEVNRRLVELNGRYNSIGIAEGGRSHDIAFDEPATVGV